MDGSDIKGALAAISPSSLSYSEWVAVGMGLKEAGYPVELWDDWSRADGRYHPGECRSKWQSFNGSEKPITIGTIMQMAMENGYRPKAGHSLDWDDWIDVDDLEIVDHAYLEEEEVSEPTDATWDPVRQMEDYLAALFKPDEFVGYVVNAWKDPEDDRWKMDRGSYSRTAAQLISALDRCGGDVGKALGDYNPEAGAWVRFNPLDGHGVKNENVTTYRYALVESDETDIAQQLAIIHELELPCAAIVHSGGKSIHAIVHVDAQNKDEYRKRVDYLYTVCEKNGLKVDTQNRNPSRLSRLPGILRNGHKQYLISANTGKRSWDEWREWVEDQTDELPDFQNLGTILQDLPPLTPPLIDGILRQGHKMLISGPSKAGKSFLLIELAIALGEGMKWIGMNCQKGRVAYVNLELDDNSCFHRFHDVYEAKGWSMANAGNIDIWNLRGRTVPMNKLAMPLIRRMKKGNYAAVIIDPIYKVITGDENAASQMAEFCNTLDKVAREANCAVIYAHHHSKGSQGWKRSMDRASGSGVFARDPDAILDLLELQISDEVRQKVEENYVCALCQKRLTEAGKIHYVMENCLNSESSMLEACQRYLPGDECQALDQEVREIRQRTATMTAFRMEATLREFRPTPPVNIWFEYPLHSLDGDGLLDEASPVGADAQGGGSGSENVKKRKTGAERERDMVEKLDEAFTFLSAPTKENPAGRDSVPMKDLMGFLEIRDVRTMAKYITLHGGLKSTTKTMTGYVSRKV